MPALQSAAARSDCRELYHLKQHRNGLAIDNRRQIRMRRVVQRWYEIQGSRLLQACHHATSISRWNPHPVCTSEVKLQQTPPCLPPPFSFLLCHALLFSTTTRTGTNAITGTVTCGHLLDKLGNEFDEHPHDGE